MRPFPLSLVAGLAAEYGNADRAGIKGRDRGSPKPERKSNQVVSKICLHVTYANQPLTTVSHLVTCYKGTDRGIVGKGDGIMLPNCSLAQPRDLLGDQGLLFNRKESFFKKTILFMYIVACQDFMYDL